MQLALVEIPDPVALSSEMPRCLFNCDTNFSLFVTTNVHKWKLIVDLCISLAFQLAFYCPLHGFLTWFSHMVWLRLVFLGWT